MVCHGLPWDLTELKKNPGYLLPLGSKPEITQANEREGIERPLPGAETIGFPIERKPKTHRVIYPAIQLIIERKPIAKPETVMANR